MKKILSLVFAMLLLFAACAQAELTVVCSLFPQYDFTRLIAGEYATVTQLLPYGMDSHEFEPSAREILATDKADLFIYTDDELETWVENMKEGFTHVQLVRCAEGIDLEELNEEWEALEEAEGHEEHEEHEGHEGHEHAYDAHIWLDPTLAAVMCENIRDALIGADPEHTEQYTASCAELVAEISALDEDFETLFAEHEGATLYFGGKFAYSHFIRRYGLNFVTAYSDCSDEGEPGARIIVNMVRDIKENGVKVLFTDELSSGAVAQEIADEAGCEVLLFHTCHNISKEDEGASYLSIMRANLENIKIALGETNEQ